MFLKYNINTTYHLGLQNALYRLGFGQNPICGINDLLMLSDGFSSVIHSEEDLAEHYTRNRLTNLSEDHGVEIVSRTEEDMRRSVLFTNKAILFNHDL